MRTRQRVHLVILSCLLLICTSGELLAQTTYLGIVPGRSSRDEVRKALGPPLRQIDDRTSEYAAQEGTGRIEVEYSGGLVERIRIHFLKRIVRSALVQSMNSPVSAARRTEADGTLTEYFGAPAYAALAYPGGSDTGGASSITYYSRGLYERIVGRTGSPAALPGWSPASGAPATSGSLNRGPGMQTNDMIWPAPSAPAPAMSVWVGGMPISFDDCKRRVSEALRAEGYGDWRDYGNGWIGATSAHRAAASCVHGAGETVVHLVVASAGSPQAQLDRLVARIRSGSPPPAGGGGGAPSPPLDPLGARWTTQEDGNWTGVWIRRGTSNVFDAVWTKGATRVTGPVTISLSGASIHGASYQQSNGYKCDYRGTLSADGQSVGGTVTCQGAGTGSWRGTITP